MLARTALSTLNAFKAQPMSRGMAVVTNFKPLTMSDLPVPQGSWKEANTKKQRSHNITLLTGVVIALATIITAKESGLVQFYFGPKIGK
ncbi:uncharacterized protein COX7B [Cherax quadricarinatus]|nr:uncharacterized protein LOC128686105 [Cherax quadricarinatus]